MFEFDPAKSAANKAKHGIDFDEAQALWDDNRRYSVPSSPITFDEERWVVIGRIGDRIWAAAVTYRSESIRIISVRRARDNEVDWYGRQDF